MHAHARTLAFPSLFEGYGRDRGPGFVRTDDERPEKFEIPPRSMLAIAVDGA
jgi:hypothetical protein